MIDSNERLIISSIARVCNLPEKEIRRRGKAKRTAPLTRARQMFTNILYDKCRYTYMQVRDAIGYKNHASAIHSKNMHEIDYLHDKHYRKTYDHIIKSLNIVIKDEEELKGENLDLISLVKQQKKEIKAYKKMMKHERRRAERYQQLLISFKKKYLLN